MKIYNDFIRTIFDYYDNQTYNNTILFDHNKIKKKTIMDITNNIINIYNNNNDLLHTGHYEILGFLDKKKNLWNWSWLIPSISNEFTKLTIYLHNYGIKLDNSDTNEHYFIKPILSNSRLIIKNNIEQDLILAVSSIFSTFLKLILIKFSYKYKFFYYLIINRLIFKNFNLNLL
jgi:hypothetical protein